MIPTDLADAGKKLAALGRAMQDQDATLSELTGLAFDCGLRLEFRLTQPEPTPSNTRSKR